jgi:hypothetical protein
MEFNNIRVHNAVCRDCAGGVLYFKLEIDDDIDGADEYFATIDINGGEFSSAETGAYYPYLNSAETYLSTDLFTIKTEEEYKTYMPIKLEFHPHATTTNSVVTYK